MRVSALIVVLGLSALSTGFTAPDAQVAFVERRGLLEIDARCHLLTPGVRSAVQAGASQARGALLRGGWTLARLGELEREVSRAARARACGDQRNQGAAAQARAAFETWSRAATMTFPGAYRSWIARRYAEPALGWRLRQDISAPRGAMFGVRDANGGQRLSLLIPAMTAARAPSAAQIVMRDPRRAGPQSLELPGRLARGLAAGAPAAQSSATFFANARAIETTEDGARFAVITFPDAAFEAMLSLDPREAIELRLDAGAATQRILVEVGDIAAASAFLALSPES